ncbi:hypothetical protein S83_012063, partial [Arachis hypogaea]
KLRYQTRKGKISTNVLGVCNRDMNFVYILNGWEESALDSRILRDVISRCNNLKILIVDAGYTNCNGFLASYRHTRYHNHSYARNIIEHYFGLLKKRWKILKSHCFYKIKTQNRIIIACYLLQNFIRVNMKFNPEQDTLLEEEQVPIGEKHGGQIDRHVWTDEETDAFVGFIEKLVIKGRRVDT